MNLFVLIHKIAVSSSPLTQIAQNMILTQPQSLKLGNTL